MKSLTIKGHVMTEPVSRTTKSGQFMCSFLLAGRSPTALRGADDCSDENGIYSVACWGELAVDASALRCDDSLLVHGNLNGYRRATATAGTSAATTAVDAVALGIDLNRALRGVLSASRQESQGARLAGQRLAAMAVHPAGRSRRLQSASESQRKRFSDKRG